MLAVFENTTFMALWIATVLEDSAFEDMVPWTSPHLNKLKGILPNKVAVRHYTQ